MVDSENLEEKISDKQEEFDEKIDDTADESNETFDDKKEKSKNIADNVINDLSKTIDEFKDSIKSMQKNADQKYQDYKKANPQALDMDLVETKDKYYMKVLVPGIAKKDVLIEAGESDITVEATFKPYIDEFDSEKEEELELIASSIKYGRCVKTVKFENNIDIENIKAKFLRGVITITIPKLIKPKHKINVE